MKLFHSLILLSSISISIKCMNNTITKVVKETGISFARFDNDTQTFVTQYKKDGDEFGYCGTIIDPRTITPLSQLVAQIIWSNFELLYNNQINQ